MASETSAIAPKSDPGAKKVYILFDHTRWLAPLREAFVEAGVAFEEWNLVERSVDLCKPPPEGVFLSKVSASCHTRGHREVAEFGRQVILWLLLHGRRVINGGHPAGAAIDFELSKVKQLASLNACGFLTPESIAVPVALLVWRDGVVEYAFPAEEPHHSAEVSLRASVRRLADAVESLGRAVVLKPNCGGRGLGVNKFEDAQECLKALRAAEQVGSQVPDWLMKAWPVDGTFVVQRCIEAEEPFVTRVEVIGGEFGYAQRSSTADGAVNLCTADGCQLGPPRFSVREDINAETPIVLQIIEFAKKQGLDIAGVEFIEEKGTRSRYVYDINPNTNYSADVQRMAGKDMHAMVANLCKSELDKLS
eukprot:TRINITY_DN17233_c0_g1_i1.p1 TRINITY_DN17233_c0_g1~~TRINITY_DN17233_c0_g1_i1.p1  ORF type:complete len:364 (-),score=59.12 TRINITY_DN17233_c0_g1_i1:86-1177(-)